MSAALRPHAHFTTPAGHPSKKGKGKGIFMVRHYAGDVAYSPFGLLDKNRDQLYRDLIELGGASTFELVTSRCRPP